jgi:hypothetical protein
MAVELLVRALHTRTPSGEKVSANATWSVLLCLCEHARNETLLCWPSHKRIKFITKMGGDAVNRALVCLEENGYITKQRTQASNRYLINTSKLQDLTIGTPDIDSQDLGYRLSEPEIPIVRDEPVIKPVTKPVIKPVGKKPPKSKPSKCITERFINHHIAKGSKFAEPSRAWQNWMTGKFTPNNKKTKLQSEGFANKDYGQSTFTG